MTLPSLILHSPEWELMSSKSLMFTGFISIMYQYSVPREAAKKPKLRVPQIPAAITRQPKVTLIMYRWRFNSCVTPICIVLIQSLQNVYALIRGREINTHTPKNHKPKITIISKSFRVEAVV